MNRLAPLALVLAAACGSDADVAGNYAAALTNRTDGCSIGWDVGDQTALNATITQSGSDVTLTVNDIAGAVFAVLVGTSTFTGSVDGDSIELAVTGTVQRSAGACDYTLNARLEASLDGDTLAGRVEYRAATNGDASCGSRASCVSTQDFNATRPPR